MAPDTAGLPSPLMFAPGDNHTRSSPGGMVPDWRKGDGTGGYQNGFSPRFPNIKDLQDEAAALYVNESAPVCSILGSRLVLRCWSC